MSLSRSRSKPSLRIIPIWDSISHGTDKSDWLWPAIWMLPTEDKYGVWPKSGEIDVRPRLLSHTPCTRPNTDGRLPSQEETTTHTAKKGMITSNLLFTGDQSPLWTHTSRRGESGETNLRLTQVSITSIHWNGPINMSPPVRALLSAIDSTRS